MDTKVRKKKFQELELCDAFLFAATMEDEEICRKVLERILEIPISRVKVRSENPIVMNPDYRSVRLDVFAADEDGTMYDIEMETAKKPGQLPRRSRFYQSQMDVAALEPGDGFIKLPRSYVIFICTFDPFSEGLFRYTFENQCIETGKKLGDETRKIFLNTKGSAREQIPEELFHFLKFVENSSITAVNSDPLLEQLWNRILQLKNNRRLEGRYMLFGELLDDERQEGLMEGRMEGLQEGLQKGRKEGRKEGQEKMNQCWSCLLRLISPEDLIRLQNNPSLIQSMFDKYHITNS